MRLAIVDQNQPARDSLAQWLGIQATTTGQVPQILSFSTIREVLPFVPSLDMIWLEATPGLRDDVAAIRASSRSLGGNLRPVIVLLTGQSDPMVAAFALAARLIAAERNSVDGVRHAYCTAALMLEDGPPQLKQVITHTCPTGPNGPCLWGEAITDISFSARTLVPIRLRIANAPAVTLDYLSRAVPPGRPQAIEGILAGISRSLFHSFWLAQVRHESVCEAAKLFGISLGSCKVCTTFLIEVEALGKRHAQLFEQSLLFCRWSGNPSEPDLTAVGGRQHDVGAV